MAEKVPYVSGPTGNLSMSLDVQNCGLEQRACRERQCRCFLVPTTDSTTQAPTKRVDIVANMVLPNVNNLADMNAE